MLKGSVSQPITATTPEWLAGDIVGQQRIGDLRFAEAKATWIKQGAEWIDNNSRQREQGLSFETEFKIPKPQRTVFFDSGAFYATSEQVDDPTLVAPVLPPPVPVPTPGVLVAGGDARDAAMFQQLSEANRGIAAIKAYFKIP